MDLTIKDLVHDIACAGIHPDAARNRVSHYASNHLLQGSRDGKNTSPIRYRPRDSAVAIALSALADCGVADLLVMHRVSGECYQHIDRCLAGLATGESWTLMVNTYRAPPGLLRAVSLVPQSVPGKHYEDVDFTPRGAIVIVLDEMLSPVVRRLSPPSKVLN